jgi:hypothetical protein
MRHISGNAQIPKITTVVVENTGPVRVCKTMGKMNERAESWFESDNKPIAGGTATNVRCPFRFSHNLQLVLHNYKEVES